MSAFFYYLGTAAESALSVFGIRAPYEQPPYTVIGHLDDGVEIRAYGARVAVETPMRHGNDGEAFGRLFRYITGANTADRHIAMTVPVEQAPAATPGPAATAAPAHIAMTIPVEMSGDQTMRFFLPKKVVKAGPPAPTDPQVHIVTLPPQHFAVIRFSGTITEEVRDQQQRRLLAAVTAAGKKPEGVPSVLSYDPPFALPFLRRNEVAVMLDEPAAASAPASAG